MYNKIKKKYHSYETVPKSNRKITETDAKLIPLMHIYMTADFTGLVLAKLIPLMHIYMTAHFTGLVLALQG
jgi:hypothetical protein